MSEISFELPKAATRIWELPVPIIVDKEKKTLTAYIAGTMEEPADYNELCHLIRNADKDTTIHLYLNTPGGILDSAFVITNALEASDAKVIGHLQGTVASAGTLISMACDEIIAEPHLSFMIHNYSGGVTGKGHEMKARQKFIDKCLSVAFRSSYIGFLTEDEINRVLEGSDLWMGTEEVVERWGKRVEYLRGVTNAK